MKYIRITCIIDPRTVMKARTDKKEDAVEIALAKLAEGLGEALVTVIERNYNTLSVLVADENLTEEGIASLREAIAKALDTGSVMLKTALMDESEAAKYLGNGASSANGFDTELKKAIEMVVAESDESDNTKEKMAALCQKAHDLIGADEFKKLVDDICRIAEYYTDKKVLCRVLCGMSYLISANRGTGRTVLPGILGRLTSLLVGYGDKVKVFEYDITDKKSPDGTLEINSVLRAIKVKTPEDSLYVYTLNIDSILNRLNGTAWLSLMEAVENNTKNRLYIFTVSCLEDIVLDNIHKRIKDNISNKIVKIPPFTNDMYIEAFKRFLSEYNMTLSDDAHDAVVKKIAEEKSDGSFRGMITVKKIISEILYYKAQRTEGVKDTVCAEDIEILLEEKAAFDISGFDRLDSLVALDNVKAKVREILAAVKLKKSIGYTGAHSMHMMFSGSPGTGKTIVARLIGQIFKEENILTKGDFYEVTRKDLVGEYVGQTSPKTAEVCKLAYGSVLFIDEAYSLANGGSNDYGKEAVSTLIAEMENNRDNMVVIFAGYEKELDSLFEINPGLRDRIPYCISFESYSRDELAQIFYMSIPASFTYDNEFRVSADEFFANLPENVLNDRSFSNGRFVRNLVERIFSKSALRMMMDSEAEKGLLTRSDFISAISDSDFAGLNQKSTGKNRIGF